ncbi:DNA repair protein XRCC1 [Folsomia candida]|uniref:DNA repair protein XRCC1 n=2 Tax=Folsomia candida TaxID=158441 RepID=A0A226DCP8_FOLCA|nr:DNA repair protein XRCC1 [Folsomia candida]
MPVVHPTSVVTFSSEDPNHPASNLLNRESFRKWKCSETSKSRSEFVILKFDQAVQIMGIDIGNEASAFIEVQVARSGTSDPKFEVLLNSAILMTASDSRNLKNPCGVRNFTIASLDKETSAQKWDLVKLIVTQQFNTQTQFGLNFVKFRAPGDPTAPAKIGVFAIRKTGIGNDEDDEDDEQFRIGTLFAKKMQKQKNGSDEHIGSPTSSTSTNAAIREVTKAISGASQSSSEHAVKEVLKRPKLDVSSSSSPGLDSKKTKNMSSERADSLGNKGPRTTNSTTTSTTSSSTSDKLPSRNNLADPPLRKQQKLTDEKDKSNQNNVSSASSSSSNSQGPVQASPSSTRKSGGGPNTGSATSSSIAFGGVRRRDSEDADKPHKPFDILFEGVVFVMSGFQNPYRKHLRDRAIEMGAKCKPDWDSSCTHLICAFINTPKFQEVRTAGNNGKIVRKEWIERSYGARVRFPWRRFCLDRNDKGAESEEEILAEEDHDDGEEDEVEEEQDPGNPPSPRANGEKVTERGDPTRAGEGQDATTTATSQDPTSRMEVDDDEDKPIAGGGGERKRKRPLPLNDDDDDDNDKLAEAYNADTDVDEDDPKTNGKEGAANNKEDSSGAETDFEEEPPTADEADSFFRQVTFFLHDPQEEEGGTRSLFNEKDRIEQIILRRNG